MLKKGAVGVGVHGPDPGQFFLYAQLHLMI